VPEMVAPPRPGIVDTARRKRCAARQAVLAAPAGTDDPAEISTVVMRSICARRRENAIAAPEGGPAYLAMYLDESELEQPLRRVQD